MKVAPNLTNQQRVYHLINVERMLQLTREIHDGTADRDSPFAPLPPMALDFNEDEE